MTSQYRSVTIILTNNLNEKRCIMRKILMIGGTGTISLAITKRLSMLEDTVVFVLNRGNNNNKLPEHVTALQGDINDVDQMKKLLKSYSFDVVCNFITFTKEQALQNVELFQGKTKQFIHIGTVVSYNPDLNVVLTEEAPFGNKYSEYGRKKAEAEAVFMEAYRRRDFPVTIIRPSQTYSADRIPLSVKGKGCWSVISRMLQGKEVIVHGDGESVWASTHADDFANGFLGVISKKETIGQAYQIMNNQPHTWNMLYQELAHLLKVQYKPVYISSKLLMQSKKYDLLSSIRGDKHYSKIFDTSKIEQLVPDFKCSITIQEGIKKYLEYMARHPELKVEEPEFDEWCDTTIAKYKKAVNFML